VAFLVGVLSALAAGLFGTATGLDRDRAFYPTITIVIGCLYSLFAVLGESMHALLFEILGGAVFVTAAVVGFRSSLWIVVAALVGHGLFDFVHGHIIPDPGVPDFWPAFCGSYDVVAGAYLAWLLGSGRLRAAI